MASNLYVLKSQLKCGNEGVVKYGLKTEVLNLGHKVSHFKVGRNPNRRRKFLKTVTPEQVKVLLEEGELWHRRMGHISPSVVHKLKYVTDGVGEMMCNLTMKNCPVCAKSKQTRKSFNKDREGATRPCQIIHADLMGPITPSTFMTKYVYIMCIVDDFTIE